MWEDEEEENMETKNFEVGRGIQLTKWEYKKTKCYENYILLLSIEAMEVSISKILHSVFF